MVVSQIQKRVLSQQLVMYRHLFLTLFNKLEIIFCIMTFYPLVLLKVLMVLEIDNIIVL